MGVGLGGEGHESEWGKIRNGVKDFVERSYLGDPNLYPLILFIIIVILMIIFL